MDKKHSNLIGYVQVKRMLNFGKKRVFQILRNIYICMI